MSEYVHIEAPTKAEAEAKAQEIIAKTDPYRQPQLYSLFEHISGCWKATVLIRGLD
jgi:hypothetical protein